MLKSSNLEDELRRWREARARRVSGRPVVTDRRTVRVNGRETLVVRKPKRPQA